MRRDSETAPTGSQGTGVNFVSLFAGVGGFDRGFEAAGMDCVGQVELSLNCRNVLQRHWPDVPKWSDIKEVKGEQFGSTDILVGGFPCQDYSVAGKGAGLAGDRGALWWEFHRLVASRRPRWVVGENVAGLTNEEHRSSLRTIIGSLVQLGYGVVWRIFDARYFGVPQQRRRIFIVGHIGNRPRPEVLALAEGCGGHLERHRQEGHIRASVASGRPWIASWPTAPTLEADRSGPASQSWKFHAAAFNESAVRRLTPVECERLQGFPDDWTTGESDRQRYRMMGNAVAVPVAEWLGNQIVKHDGNQAVGGS
jgi:DNA (cytosine-5)-methyltransferase 1